ncbi:MAG: VOC family protein [Gemmatimonadales bacterium]
MQLVPYLNFNGQCAEAFRFYEQCLGGKIVGMQTHGESPIAGDVPPEWHDKIIHARLEVGGAVLMASDSPPEYYERPQGLYVAIQIDEPAEADRIFHALADRGTVKMPIQQTFWAARFGMVVDRFSTPWMVNCGQPA